MRITRTRPHPMSVTGTSVTGMTDHGFRRLPMPWWRHRRGGEWRGGTVSPVDRFRALHGTGLFVMPNAWDEGSARLLEHLGFAALATTSSGHAGSLGRLDQRVTRDELLAHVERLVAAVDVPVSVDAEGCFP